jgi:prepilin-type N-terminal cleavage/methylation domain-containing protein
MNKSTKQRGFTLIELICVVVIVTVMLIVGVVNVEYLVPKYRLRAAAREIGKLLKTARTRAATMNKDVYVQFDFENQTCCVLVPFKKETEGESPQEEYEYRKTMQITLPEGVSLFDVIVSEEEKASSDTYIVRISPFGFATNIIVNLENKQGDKQSVELNGITGGLTFYNEHRSAYEMLEDFGY